MRLRDYTIIPAMSAGPSLPQAPAGMVQVTNDKVSACEESYFFHMLYYVTSAAEVLLSEHGLDPGDPNG